MLISVCKSLSTLDLSRNFTLSMCPGCLAHFTQCPQGSSCFRFSSLLVTEYCFTVCSLPISFTHAPDGHFNCHHLWATVTKAAGNVDSRICVQSPCLPFFRVYSGSRISGLLGHSVLIRSFFCGTALLPSWWPCHFYCPLAVHKRPSFLYPALQVCFFLILLLFLTAAIPKVWNSDSLCLYLHFPHD